MAPRQRDAPPAPGFLASAFNFVTHELELFATAAAGGEVKSIKQPQVHEQPEASSSRVTLDGKRREREGARGEREWRGKRSRKKSEAESERARARRRVRREEDDGSDDDRDRALRAMKKRVQPPVVRPRSAERGSADDEDDAPPPRHISAKTPKKRREVLDAPPPTEDVAEVVDEPAARHSKKKSAKTTDKSTDPSELMPPPPTPMRPPPLPAARFATPVSTMPGSLFPRSASLIPETPAIPQRTVPRPRTPPPAPQTIIEEAEEEMVEEAPEQPRKRGRSQDRRSSHPTDENGDTARPSSLRDSSRHSDASGRAASSSRRSLDDPEEPVSRPRSRKGKERACDTSGEVRVRGKERELREAREDHARNAHERDGREREHDKQRIRMLEEEVARLRAELASKGSGSMMPPPPPPPPPPPLFRPQATTILSGENGSYLASARALLKPTAPPVEAPINGAAYGGARAKKAGHPTVNVPSDKMAAFLREMKNVRLRRVGGLTGDTSMSSATAAGAVGETAGDLNRSTSGTGMSRARMAATLGERSFDLGVATRLEIGEKRKRDAFEESVAGPSKRRETTFLHSNDTGASTSASSSQSSTSSSQSSSSSQTSSFSAAQSSSSRTSLFEMPPPRSQPARPRNSAPLRIWPTGSMAETDLTTPSLCSDNENDHEAEDKLPETPSDSGRGSKSKDAGMLEPKREPEHEVIDVDALDTPPKRAATPKRPVVDKNDAFSRRPPASPLPASSKTPSKPRPPARAAKSKIPLPQAKRAPAPQPEDDRGSESDDPLAAAPVKPESRGRSYSAQDDPPRPGPSRIRRNSSASSSVRSGSHTRETRPASRLSNHARRRLTLDEEMRRAGDSLWQPSEDEQGAAESPDEEGPETGLDSGELVALGTRSSKRGFLARGGGAGVPVFMAEGYVRGASSKEGEGSAVRSRSNTGESARSRAGESSRRRR